MKETAPNASIVIPVYNDPQGVTDTLSSILENTGGEPEIIVVDNNSTDETAEVIREYAGRYEHVQLRFERDVQSSYAARNTGIEHATGDVIVFLDADQSVPKYWLTDILKEHRRRDAHYLAPDVRLVVPPNVTLAGQYNYHTGFPIAEFIRLQGFAPTACLCVTRSLLENVGGFDERLVSGGDKEFGNRVSNAGYELHYTPDVVIHHPVRNNLNSLVKRNLRIGRGHCQLQRYYPNRYGRVGIPPRPSGIHSDQIGTRNGTEKSTDEFDDRSSKKSTGTLGISRRVLLSVVAFTMTVTRGVGYYSECMRVLWDRISGDR